MLVGVDHSPGFRARRAVGGGSHGNRPQILRNIQCKRFSLFQPFFLSKKFKEYLVAWKLFSYFVSKYQSLPNF